MTRKSPPKNRWRLRRDGFTLIDVVITVLIIGIISAVAAPKFSEAIVRYRADASAKRVAADLALARRKAISDGKSRSVTFNVGANTYDLPGVEEINKSGRPYSVDLTNTGYPASLVSADFDGDPNVTFNLYGQPLAAGSPLGADGTVVIASGSEQRTVTVNAVTGKANIP